MIGYEGYRKCILVDGDGSLNFSAMKIPVSSRVSILCKCLHPDDKDSDISWGYVDFEIRNGISKDDFNAFTGKIDSIEKLKELNDRITQAETGIVAWRVCRCIKCQKMFPVSRLKWVAALEKGKPIRTCKLCLKEASKAARRQQRYEERKAKREASNNEKI